MNDKSDKVNIAIGFAVFCGNVTGVVSVFLALSARYHDNWMPSAVCLVAAALAFGLTANALLRR